jgi:ribonuclease HI
VRTWSPPLNNDLIFNVDGSARGNPNRAGIGGVLRDVRGQILCLFSASIGAANSILAKVLAIHRACELVSTCQFSDDKNITIMSDCKAAVSWINGEGFGNLSLVRLVYDIRQLIMSRNNISIVFTPRSSNSLSDILAKARSHSNEDRLE